jgi:hypothetical protein
LGTVYIDNDVLHKMAAYGLLNDLLHARPWGADCFCMLGAARFIVAKKLRKQPPEHGLDNALTEFEAALAKIAALEPSDDEIRLAADLEYAAQQLDVDLDAGESVLCAVLLYRGADYIFSGDKRAIIALQVLLDAAAVASEVRQRLVCLEQLFLWLLQGEQCERIRAAVCAEPAVDRALSNCFSCRSAGATIESWREGLASYIRDLARQAPDVLVAGP